jgi:hypothetical protein
VFEELSCVEESAQRKHWNEDWLKELDEIFATNVDGFAIMDNQLYALLRLDLERAKAWLSEEVVLARIERCLPKVDGRKPVVVIKGWITDRAKRTTKDRHQRALFRDQDFRDMPVLYFRF